MEKIQAQVEKASAEQREKFEAQLAEMAEKLRQAEERNQRAMSMAQQTRMGHVYVISNVGSFGEDIFKIGLTRRLEPLDRVRELGDASVPFSFDVHAMIFNEDAPALETALHRHFLTAQVNKVNPRMEFFRVPVKIIREELDKLGIKAQWTMAAEAKECCGWLRGARTSSSSNPRTSTESVPEPVPRRTPRLPHPRSPPFISEQAHEPGSDRQGHPSHRRHRWHRQGRGPGICTARRIPDARGTERG
jgi:hypothetical protein